MGRSISRNLSRKQRRTLSVPDQHRLRIAKDTLKMSDVGARIMGGMTKDEARAFLKECGINPARYE